MEDFEYYENLRKQERLNQMQRDFRSSHDRGLADGPLAQVAVTIIGVILTIIVITLAEGVKGHISPVQQDTGNGGYHRAG